MQQTFAKYREAIQDMIEKIERYTKNINEYGDFIKDDEKIDACITPLIQIWEIAGQMSKYYPQNQNIPYKDIIWFRNILVHTYHKVDYKALRNIIKFHIPKLKEIIQKETIS